MPTSYDAVSYPGHAHPETHPDRLATMARLFGLRPAPVDNCRVLELGCGNGSNLIPLATVLPGSRFLGVDLAGIPVAEGQRLIADLGLDNVELRQADVMEMDAAAGRFDYIVAHGFYSWVPEPVREHALELCRRCLAPHGVAFVSYNAYPGAHIRNMLREMMRFHVQGIEEPQQRIREALALAEYLSGWKHQRDSYRSLMEDECARVKSYHPGHLYHDDLAEVNQAFYFHQFMERAEAHGLQYLAEAELYEMQAPSVPDGCALPRLPAPDQVVLREQYADFVRCRRFRETLLVHREVQVDRQVRPERVQGMWVSAEALPASQHLDLSPNVVEKFRIGEAALDTDHPLGKLALLELGAVWPRGVRFEDLLATARARLEGRGTNGDENPGLDAAELAEIVLKMYAAKLCELRTFQPEFVLEPGIRPKATELARHQIRGGKLVVNQLHQNVEITDEAGRYLLEMLDGALDREGLAVRMSARLGAQVSPVLLDQNLGRMARRALLVA